MARILVALVFFACQAGAQGLPNFTGVWKLNPDKSRVVGRKMPDLLMRVDHWETSIRQRVLVKGPPEVFNTLSFVVGSGEIPGQLDGMPARTRARWEATSLALDISFGVGDKVRKYSEKWSLAADGQSLISNRFQEGREELQVYDRAPPEAAAEFQRPERTAAEAYKNIRILKISAANLIGAMVGYQVGLGVGCDHCHVSNTCPATPAIGMR